MGSNPTWDLCIHMRTITGMRQTHMSGCLCSADVGQETSCVQGPNHIWHMKHTSNLIHMSKVILVLFWYLIFTTWSSWQNNYFIITIYIRNMGEKILFVSFLPNEIHSVYECVCFNAVFAPCKALCIASMFKCAIQINLSCLVSGGNKSLQKE